jgi:hypothetical protein
VILPGEYVNATGHLPQPVPVGRDCRRIVTHPMAQVIAVKWRPAPLPRSAHNGMGQSRNMQERQELKQIVLLIFYQKQLFTSFYKIIAKSHWSLEFFLN